MSAPERDDDYAWQVAAADVMGLDPWDCERPAPDRPCVRPGHKLLPCQWERPEDWPW